MSVVEEDVYWPKQNNGARLLILDGFGINERNSWVTRCSFGAQSPIQMLSSPYPK